MLLNDKHRHFFSLAEEDFENVVNSLVDDVGLGTRITPGNFKQKNVEAYLKEKDWNTRNIKQQIAAAFKKCGCIAENNVIVLGVQGQEQGGQHEEVSDEGKGGEECDKDEYDQENEDGEIEIDDETFTQLVEIVHEGYDNDLRIVSADGLEGLEEDEEDAQEETDEKEDD